MSPVVRKPVVRVVDLGCEMRQVGHAQDTPMEPCLLADFWKGVRESECNL